jgi:hypothetical protein
MCIDNISSVDLLTQYKNVSYLYQHTLNNTLYIYYYDLLYFNVVLYFFTCITVHVVMLALLVSKRFVCPEVLKGFIYLTIVDPSKLK